MSDDRPRRPPPGEPSQVIRRDPRHDPRYRDPRYRDPGHPEPRYRDPGYRDPIDPSHRPPVAPPRLPPQRPAPPPRPSHAYPPRPPKPPTPKPPTPKPPTPTPPTSKPRRRRWIRRIPLAIMVVLVLAVAAVVGGGCWIDTGLHRTAVLTDYSGRPSPGRGTTWLLVGSDSRSNLSPQQQAELATGGDVGEGRTDTILLVHLPGLGSGTPASMVSIPRDSYVPIPGHGRDKINAAFALGGGPLLVRTVEQATGIRLDHYAEIGFAGFAEVVDAVGGVTICPNQPISDPLAGIDLPAGCQKLDGRNALGYVRTRATPRADLDRMVNQRRFMSALLHRVASPAVWLDPLRWYPVATGTVDALTVDQGAHVWDLARLGWALRGATVTATVPIGQFTSNDAGSVVVWNSELADRLFTAIASDSPLPPEALTPPP